MNFTNALINGIALGAELRTRGSKLVTIRSQTPSANPQDISYGMKVVGIFALRRFETQKNEKESAELVTDTCLRRI